MRVEQTKKLYKEVPDSQLKKVVDEIIKRCDKTASEGYGSLTISYDIVEANLRPRFVEMMREEGFIVKFDWDQRDNQRDWINVSGWT